MRGGAEEGRGVCGVVEGDGEGVEEAGEEEGADACAGEEGGGSVCAEEVREEDAVTFEGGLVVVEEGHDGWDELRPGGFKT